MLSASFKMYMKNEEYKTYPERQDGRVARVENRLEIE